MEGEKTFPNTDVTDERTIQAADEWLETMGNMDNGQFVSKISMDSYVPALAGFSGPYRTREGSVVLCRAWDNVRKEKVKRSLTSYGYLAALVFNKHSHLLPGFNVNFSAQTARMQQPGEELHLAHYFAQNAWRSMQEYPTVHAKFERLHEITSEKMQPLSDEHGWDLRAGMGLYYMQVLIGNIEENGHNFTSMVDLSIRSNRKNLGTTPFRDFFTTGAELAPDVVLPKEIKE